MTEEEVGRCRSARVRCLMDDIPPRRDKRRSCHYLGRHDPGQGVMPGPGHGRQWGIRCMMGSERLR